MSYLNLGTFSMLLDLFLAFKPNLPYYKESYKVI